MRLRLLSEDGDIDAALSGDDPVSDEDSFHHDGDCIFCGYGDGAFANQCDWCDSWCCDHCLRLVGGGVRWQEKVNSGMAPVWHSVCPTCLVDIDHQFIQHKVLWARDG